jgi:hypothetical protein
MATTAAPTTPPAPTVPEPTKPSILDKLLPVGVGGRTEIGLALLVLVVAAKLAGWITPEALEEFKEILYPVAGLTFAAKVQRLISKK